MRNDGKGKWSRLATYVVVAIASVLIGPELGSGWKELSHDMLHFFNGELLEPSNAKDDLWVALPESLAVLVLDVPVAVFLGLGARAIFRGKRGSARDLTQPSSGKKSSARDIFKRIFIVIFLEEVFARWLFLGLIWPWVGGGVVAFYILFLVGNGIWALVHLYNWTDEGPHPSWTLPQFWGGILLTILYVKHGFVVALLAHFAYNCIFFCSMAKQRFDVFDALHIGLGVLYVGLGHLMLSQNPSDALNWFRTRETIALEGWGLWDYTILPLILAGWSAIIFGILGYDQSGANSEPSDSSSKKKITVHNPLLFLVILLLAVAVLPLALMGANYGVFWLSTKVSASVPIAAVAAGIVWTFRQKDESLSAMCRTFWSSVPISIAVMCALQALSVWQGYILIWSFGLLMIPISFLSVAGRHE
jgi:hypothetical protein